MTIEHITRPILVVEDNPVDLDLALRAFKRSNLDNPIEIARDGEEALAWIARWEAGERLPAVILLDLKLPRIDGLEVLRQLKANDTSKVIPVVILTSSGEDSDLKKAYAFGVNSYIVKPVDFDKFMEVAGQIKLYWCVYNKTLP